MGPPRNLLIDEIEATVRRAAGENKVLVIRLAAGREISISKEQLAHKLHERFPQASIEVEEINGNENADAVIVKNIEVE